MATHSSILVWEIPRTKEPGGLQSMGLPRIRHNWVDKHTGTQKCVYMCFSSAIYLIYTPNSNSTNCPLLWQNKFLCPSRVPWGIWQALKFFFSLLLIWEVSLICLWLLRPWCFIFFLKMNWLVWRIIVWWIFLLIHTGNGFNKIPHPFMGPVAQLVNNQPAMWETWIRSLGWEDPLEKGKATHSITVAWRIGLYSPWGCKESDTTEPLSLHPFI